MRSESEEGEEEDHRGVRGRRSRIREELEVRKSRVREELEGIKMRRRRRRIREELEKGEGGSERS